VEEAQQELEKEPYAARMGMPWRRLEVGIRSIQSFRFGLFGVWEFRGFGKVGTEV
jgi:hypothetical protein